MPLIRQLSTYVAHWHILEARHGLDDAERGRPLFPGRLNAIWRMDARSRVATVVAHAYVEVIPLLISLGWLST